MVRFPADTLNEEGGEKATTETTETPENTETEKETVSKGNDTPKSEEATGSQQTENTSETETKDEKDVEVEQDRVSYIEKELLECKRRLEEMEYKTASSEKRLCKTMETMTRKLDSVMEQQRRLCSPPLYPPQNRWGFQLPTALQAAEVGNAPELLRLLAAEEGYEAQLRMRDGHGDTALHLAARGGHASAVRILLVAGACASTPGRRLRTPLHYAAANGHLQIVQRLLIAGAVVDAKDAEGSTPLAVAAMSGHVQVVATLLKNGARSDSVDEKGVSPIFHAASGGYAKVVCLLLENGVSMDDCVEGDSLLGHAAKAGQWSVVKLLMDKGASLKRSSKPEESLLALAAKDGQGDIVRDLLKNSKEADKEKVECALSEAKTASVVWALAEVFPQLVRGEAGNWGLLYAAERGQREVLIALLEAGVEMRVRDSSGITPLHTAAWNGHYECIQELLTRGADTQWKDNSGDTPLHKAAFADQLHCIQVLLEAGAKKDEVNNKGKTPEDVAATEAARRILNGKGILSDYIVRNATRLSDGLRVVNQPQQFSSNPSGQLLGTASQPSGNETKGSTSFSFSLVNTEQGKSGFGMPGHTHDNGIKRSSKSGGFGQGNVSQGNSVFGSSGQTFGQEIKHSSLFTGNVTSSPSIGVFGGQSFGTKEASLNPKPVNTLTASLFGAQAQSVNNGVNNIKSGSFGQNDSSTSSSLIGMPAASQGIGPISISSSHQINSQSGNSVLESVGQQVSGGDQSVNSEKNEFVSLDVFKKTAPSGYNIYKKASQ